MHKGLQLFRCTTVAIMLGSRQLRYLLVADVSTTIAVAHAAGVASCGVHGEVEREWWGGARRSAMRGAIHVAWLQAAMRGTRFRGKCPSSL